jgi:hypothetical protein
MSRRSAQQQNFWVGVLLIAAVIGWLWWRSRQHLPAASLSATDPRCVALPTLWQHVYHPDRLEVHDACRTVTGTVRHIRREPDGDLHVQVELDAGQENLLNDANVLQQHGFLVVEFICEAPVRQADAMSACANWSYPERADHGAHMALTGAYVLDREHGWMELHPVSDVASLR